MMLPWCWQGPFNSKQFLFRWMKIETTQLLFVQSMLNRSSDLSGLIKLAKFRLFIRNWSLNKQNLKKFVHQWKAWVRKLTRYVYFGNTTNESEIIR